MNQRATTTTLCLEHQLPEDHASPVGLVCRRCKQRLYTLPPAGNGRGFWESQPPAYSLDGRPCFVYSLMWDDYRIRSLHPPDSHEDPRGERVRAAARSSAASPPAWIDDFRIEPDRLSDEEDV